MEKICQRCQEVFEAQNKERLCPACRKLSKAISNKNYREKKKTKKIKPEKLDKTECSQCYFKGFLNNMIICNYAEIAGECRKCELPPNCDKFRPGERKKKNNFLFGFTY